MKYYILGLLCFSFFSFKAADNYKEILSAIKKEEHKVKIEFERSQQMYKKYAQFLIKMRNNIFFIGSFFDEAKELLCKIEATKEEAQKKSKKLNPKKLTDFLTTVNTFNSTYRNGLTLLGNFHAQYAPKETCTAETQTDKPSTQDFQDAPQGTPFSAASECSSACLARRPSSESIATTVSDISISPSVASMSSSTDSESNSAERQPDAPKKWSNVFRYSVEQDVWPVAEKMAKATKLPQEDLNFALFRATGAGYTDGVKLFMQQGAQVNYSDQDGVTALHLACANSSKEITEELTKDAHININALTTITKSTPAHEAAQKGSKDIVTLLFAKKADIALTNSHGKTAMDYLREYRDTRSSGQNTNASIPLVGLVPVKPTPAYKHKHAQLKKSSAHKKQPTF